MKVLAVQSCPTLYDPTPQPAHQPARGQGQPPRGCGRRHGADPGLAMARSARQPPEWRGGVRLAGLAGRRRAGRGRWGALHRVVAESPRSRPPNFGVLGLGLRSGRRPGPRSGLQGRKMLRDPRAAVWGHRVPGSCRSPPMARSTVCTARSRGAGRSRRKGDVKPRRGLRRFRPPGSPVLSDRDGGCALSWAPQAPSAGGASWCRRKAGSYALGEPPPPLELPEFVAFDSITS